MPIFNSNPHILDITELQKRGILKKLEEKNKSAIQESNEYINLKNLQQNTPAIQTRPTTIQQDSSPLSFLDSLASSNFQTTQKQETQPRLQIETETEIKNLQVKIENIEYKLDRFLDKLAAIEAKISAL